MKKTTVEVHQTSGGHLMVSVLPRWGPSWSLSTGLNWRSQYKSHIEGNMCIFILHAMISWRWTPKCTYIRGAADKLRDDEDSQTGPRRGNNWPHGGLQSCWRRPCWRWRRCRIINTVEIQLWTDYNSMASEHGLEVMSQGQATKAEILKSWAAPLRIPMGPE